MYTRSYNGEASEIIIPERYGGTSFGQGYKSDGQNADAKNGQKNPWEGEEVHTPPPEESAESTEASATPTRLPFGGIFSGIFKNGSLSLQKIGKEELLIIATAIFLLFSKEGDKECAIMLFLLLFLN